MPIKVFKHVWGFLCGVHTEVGGSVDVTVALDTANVSLCFARLRSYCVFIVLYPTVCLFEELNQTKNLNFLVNVSWRLVKVIIHVWFKLFVMGEKFLTWNSERREWNLSTYTFYFDVRLWTADGFVGVEFWVCEMKFTEVGIKLHLQNTLFFNTASWVEGRHEHHAKVVLLLDGHRRRDGGGIF